MRPFWDETPGRAPSGPDSGTVGAMSAIQEVTAIAGVERGLHGHVASAWDRALGNLHRRQLPDGHWSGDYGGPMFLLPGLVIACRVTGTDLTPYEQARMVEYLTRTQHARGGWGLHVAGEPTVLGTGLNYAALRLLGVPASDDRAVRARACLHRLGGAEAIPAWGKAWLAVLGVYRWEGVSPVPPELWLLPRWIPAHPGRFWCHTRAVYLPMSYLYARRAQGPQTATVRALREEMFLDAWDRLDWPALRGRVASTDLYAPHSAAFRGLRRALAAYERRPVATLRERAVRFTLEQIRHEDEATAYLDIGPVSKAMHLCAAWFAEPDSDAVQRHRERLRDYVWDGADGMKMQGYNGSQFWDLAFAVLAVTEAGLPDSDRARDLLQRAHGFLDAHQVRHDVPDRARHFRDRTQGMWPFSTAEQAWPVTDCTAEGVKAALRLRPLVSAPVAPERLRQAVDRLLEYQNPDGGWSEYERARAGRWLEALNPAEIFGHIMTAYSYPECTSACIQGLQAFRATDPDYRARHIARAVRRGVAFLRRAQRPDGSWYGGWGICFTYGTWFGIDGLHAAGAPPDHPALRRAAAFLLARQRPDGGWSESYRACVEARYIETSRSQSVQTAWALLGLMTAGAGSAYRPAIERGIRLLLARQTEEGAWPQEDIAGIFNRTCAIHYDNYRHVMPLWALSRYRRLYARDGAG